MASFKKNFIPTLIVSIVFIILVSLGSWQVYRLQWKNNLIKEIETKIKLPAGSLPESDADLAALKYHRVKFKGEFLHDKEIHLYAGNRVYKGEPGYLILTPMKRENGSFILVNRGWVSEKLKNSATRTATLNKGPVEVEGYLFEAEHKTWVTPNNDLAKNLWFWIDIDTISKYTNLKLPDMIVVRKKESNDELPIGKELIAANIRNDHLAYAITWYGAAVSLLVIYLIALKKKDE